MLNLVCLMDRRVSSGFQPGSLRSNNILKRIKSKYIANAKAPTPFRPTTFLTGLASYAISLIRSRNKNISLDIGATEMQQSKSLDLKMYTTFQIG